MKKGVSFSMEKRKILKITVLTAAALLAVTLGITIFFGTQYVSAGGNMYSRNQSLIDLRGKNISLDRYRELAGKLRGGQILWDVPFQGSLIASNVKSVTIESLSEADVSVMDYFTDLETVDAEGCTDYAALVALQQRRPSVAVNFSLPIAGKEIAVGTKTLSIEGLTQADVPMLEHLTQLEKLEVSGCEDYALLQQLQIQHPEWDLSYTVQLGSKAFDWDEDKISVTGVTAEVLDNALSGLPKVSSVELQNPDADGKDLVAIREKYPQANLRWQVEVYGQLFADDATEVDISGAEVASCEDVEKLVACLPDLEKLIMSDCGIDSETMAQFRERQRENYKVVWTVYIGEHCVVRTDDIYFMPIQQGEYYLDDSMTEELKYCEDMICIDVGHHMIHNIDFVVNMSHLKYLVLAHGGVRDLSPIVNCQELVYLEVDWSEIQDYTPIASLKNLEDLNINRTYCDITPLLQMTWLKNLWAMNRSYSVGQQLKDALPDTHIQLSRSEPEGQRWRQLKNYYDMRDILGMPYMR